MVAFQVLDRPPAHWKRPLLSEPGFRVRYVDIIALLAANGRPRNKPRPVENQVAYCFHITASYSTLAGFVDYIVRNWIRGGTPTIPSCLNCWDVSDGYVQFLDGTQIGIATVNLEPVAMSVETVNKGVVTDPNCVTARQLSDHAHAFAQGVRRGWWPYQVVQREVPNFVNGGFAWHTERGDSHKSNCSNGTSGWTVTCGKTCPGPGVRGYTTDRKLYPWAANGSNLLGHLDTVFQTAGGLIGGGDPEPPEDDMPKFVSGLPDRTAVFEEGGGSVRWVTNAAEFAGIVPTPKGKAYFKGRLLVGQVPTGDLNGPWVASDFLAVVGGPVVGAPGPAGPPGPPGLGVTLPAVLELRMPPA